MIGRATAFPPQPMTVEPPAPVCHPFVPPPAVAFDPAWRTEAVLALVEGIEAEHHYDRLPILADALEEAGCDQPELLDHCRRCDAHHRGCWVMKLVLGRDPKPAPFDDPRVLAILREAARPSPAFDRLRNYLARPRRVPDDLLVKWAGIVVLASVAMVYVIGLTVKRPPAGDPLLTPRFLNTPPTFDFRKQQELIDRLTPPTRTSPP